jgi:hypothetical protein
MRPHAREQPPAAAVTIDVKVVVQFIMRIDHAARLAIGSRERWETGLRADFPTRRMKIPSEGGLSSPPHGNTIGGWVIWNGGWGG